VDNLFNGALGMITCYLRYEINPDKIAEFEAYGAMWLDLMPRFGGTHHGHMNASRRADCGRRASTLANWKMPSSTSPSTPVTPWP